MMIKIQMTSLSNDILHSDYWLPDHGFEESDTLTLFKLASARRAISNFVNILTLQNIPVVFAEQDSMTDGKVVYIGGDIDKPSKFDIGVGLSLHEASHVIYTDFDIVKNIWAVIPDDIYKSAQGLTSHNLIDLSHTIFNYVEDRYIDSRVYKSAKGYRTYYKKLYTEYFNNDTVTDELKGPNFRKSDIDSYLFRIINLTNPNSDLDALKKLPNIVKIIDLPNILRLNTTEERLECAFDVVREILTDMEDEIQSNMVYSSTYTSSSVNPFPLISEDINKNSSISDSTDQYSSGSKDTGSFDISGYDSSIFDENRRQSGKSEDMFSILPNSVIHEDKNRSKSDILNKQKDFVNSHGNKKTLSQEIFKKLNIIGDFNADIENTQYNGEKVDVIVIKNVNPSSMSTDEFPISNKFIRTNNGYSDAVNFGIAIGTKIGNRLLLRNEINIEKYSRRSSGKLDKKILHEIGFENENVFYFTDSQKYKDMDIHITVDASSSMSFPPKWENTLTLTTALAKAVSMLNNVRLSISFRSTVDNYPCLILVYNSDKDNFFKIRNVFPYLHPQGLTPEGLTYSSLLKHMSSKGDSNKFFINICDGQPYFDGSGTKYQGNSAVNHTRKEVNKIKSLGYNIISYFIESIGSDGSVRIVDQTCRYNFKKMYGRDSHFIDTGNMTQILNTIQKKMWEK